MSKRTIGLSDALYEYTLAHEVVMEAEAPFIEEGGRTYRGGLWPRRPAPVRRNRGFLTISHVGTKRRSEPQATFARSVPR